MDLQFSSALEIQEFSDGSDFLLPFSLILSIVSLFDNIFGRYTTYIIYIYYTIF